MNSVIVPERRIGVLERETPARFFGHCPKFSAYLAGSAAERPAWLRVDPACKRGAATAQDRYAPRSYAWWIDENFHRDYLICGAKEWLKRLWSGLHIS